MYLQNISGVFVYFPGRGARRVERPAARLGPLARVPRVTGARGAVQAGLGKLKWNNFRCRQNGSSVLPSAPGHIALMGLFGL